VRYTDLKLRKHQQLYFENTNICRNKIHPKLVWVKILLHQNTIGHLGKLNLICQKLLKVSLKMQSKATGNVNAVNLLKSIKETRS